METKYQSGEDDLTVTIEEGEATGKDAKPKFLSKAWWKSLFTAMKVHKYTARDWGIWNLSTLSTYGVIFGVFKPAAMFVATKAPWLVTALGAIKTALIASFKWLVGIIVAAWHIATG